MMRWLLPLGLVAWVGCTLLLSQLRWFSRRPLDQRLAPYVPGGWKRARRGGVLSVDSFREVIGPLASGLGDSVGRVLGARDSLADRLHRIHSPLDPVAVRVRQLTWSAVAFVAAVGVGIALRFPIVAGTAFVLAAPLLAYLVQEQRLVAEAERWQRRVFLELPVVSEQIGMLLSAGYSLGAAIGRVAERGSGAVAMDLRRVTRRVRQGLSDVEALREWADTADVAAVHRLVGVLGLNRDTGDLGRLIAEEARAIRREVHRQLMAQLDRRSQQVWIPVTVATLLPGSIFIAVPFLQALRLYSGT